MENWLVAVRFTSEDNFQNNMQRQREREREGEGINGIRKSIWIWKEKFSILFVIGIHIYKCTQPITAIPHCFINA